MEHHKAFHFANAQIGTISTRVDGGIGFRISTGEIPVENLAHFLSLKQQNVEVKITPLDMQEGDEPIEVSSEVKQKSQSERLYNVLFIWHKQLGLTEPFSQFYHRQTNLIIDKIKSKLEPES
jgi:hypothetical protein